MGACRLKLDLERVGLELQVLRPNTTNAKDYKDEVWKQSTAETHRAHSRHSTLHRLYGSPMPDQAVIRVLIIET